MDFETLKTQEIVKKVENKMGEGNFRSFLLGSKVEVLAKIKELIPEGASVMNGSSTTLNEIGYIDYLKSGEHPWNNLHEKILAEKDQKIQAKLRKETTISDYYLGSAVAVTEEGEILVASNSGSQLPGLTFNASHVILVLSTNKIVKNIEEAFKRLYNYTFPLEDARMKSVGMGGSGISKILIYKKEPEFLGRTFTVIFVDEKLGY
ncbi:MAG: lactate utilization protein [Candidatus Magasanikbacteria bacterium CG10_big_fil_rev_8_21_14_0_10_36_16]|uniref:Lactate utilization protein n=1 Tax=Candidatus Magasanikbacteria bacterium CG10_big_fil_rev_8_21_14_0_10_36_16 TaxID=1974645 RepID=A0A2H0TZB4_9BACT|nr:MAG: lactate utilization protein [Candidatus Magasanikbacteria bacterium CG10_big_fil_rev_8_21_14_0_10_36_16]